MDVEAIYKERHNVVDVIRECQVLTKILPESIYERRHNHADKTKRNIAEGVALQRLQESTRNLGILRRKKLAK